MYILQLNLENKINQFTAKNESLNCTPEKDKS